jgi:site-specific DNA-methyltransferase (adenine-specific)
MINLIHGDCMEYMATLKDNQFDLAVVDPPYGIGNWIPNNVASQSKKQTVQFKEVEWNQHPPSQAYFDELRRVSKRQIIWGTNYYPNQPPNPVLVWYKKIGNPNFSDVEIASLSWGKRCDFIHINWQSGFYRTMTDGKQIHPCQKPIQLYQWIFDKYAKKGWRILDTHLGSGSSAIAAFDCGLEFVGIELDDDYFKAAKERLEEHQKQLRLFK